MSIGVSEASLSDIAAVTNRNDCYGNDMFGGNGAWWLIVLLLFGWGRNGFGGYGGGYGAGASAPCATQADVRAAVDQQTLISKIDQQTYGLADSFTALNNTLNNNFRGIDNAVCTLGYQGAQHASNLAAQMAQCCCDTRAAIKDVDVGIERAGWNLSKQISDGFCNEEKMNMQNRFDAQAYNCNTLQAIDKLGDRIDNRLNAMEKARVLEQLDAERTKNAILQGQIDRAQLRYDIVNDVKPCPGPAYIVQPPQQVTFPTNCCGGVNYASYNNGCGCGC